MGIVDQRPPTATYLPSLIAWGALATGSALAIGIAAASVQLAGVAPVGIAAVVTGACLGGAVFGWARWCGIRITRSIYWATVILALIAVAAEHGWLYRNYRQEWHRVRAEHPELALFRHEENAKSLLAYLAEETTPGRAVFWIVDATLLTAAAVAMVAMGERWWAQRSG